MKVSIPSKLVLYAVTGLKFLTTRSTVSLTPVMFPQTTVCTANVHMPPSVGTSVQVTVVWVVVVGQLPQFDDRML